MNEPKVAITVLCAALLIPSSRDIAAQLASKVEAGQYTVRDGALPMSAIRFAPTVQFEFPHGTLKAREGLAASGFAHLKGGTLTGVQSMAGYVLDRAGRRWIVVMIVNHPNANAAQGALDALVDWVREGAR